MKRFAICSGVSLTAGMLVLAQLNVPRLGMARFPDGSVHSVRGVAANLIVDPRAIAQADCAAFSDSAGLIAKNGLIQLVRPDGTPVAQYQSTEPLPVLNIDSAPQSAAAWLPSQHLLLRWDGNQFIETPVDDSSFAGKVTSLNLTSNAAAQFFATRADSSVVRITVSLPSGRVTSLDIQPAAHGSALLQQGWLLSEGDRGLIAEKPNGFQQAIPLSQQPLPPNDLTIERMSTHWLHIYSHSTDTSWAVFVDTAKLNAFLLPPPVKEPAR